MGLEAKLPGFSTSDNSTHLRADERAVGRLGCFAVNRFSHSHLRFFGNANFQLPTFFCFSFVFPRLFYWVSFRFYFLRVSKLKVFVVFVLISDVWLDGFGVDWLRKFSSSHWRRVTSFQNYCFSFPFYFYFLFNFNFFLF